jgi:hypothetical protein
MRAGAAWYLGVILLVGGCGAESTGPGPSAWPPDVAGTWHWIESQERAPGGATLTPASEGYEATLEMVQQGSEGTFTYSVDGIPMASGDFGMAYEDAPGNNFVFWSPPFADYQAMQWMVVIPGDRLLLIDATVGGYEVRLARSGP